MSLEDRITILEEKGNQLVQPIVHCIFCHPAEGGFKNSPSWHAGYEFVKKVLLKNGITRCDHSKLGIESWWFAEFVYSSLLSEMISNYNPKQSDPDTNRWVLSQCSIMDKAFQNDLEEHIRLFADSLYKQSEYWKYRKEMLIKFRKWATQLYSDDITGLEELQTRTDLAVYEYYNHPSFQNRKNS